MTNVWRIYMLLLLFLIILNELVLMRLIDKSLE